MLGTTESAPIRLGCELLESRDNPAGSVSAVLSGGWLHVTGDGADNAISIQQNQVGDIIIYGYNGTTVNGVSAAYVGTGRLDRLSVEMGDGHDYVDVVGVMVNSDMSVFTGTGTDSVYLVNSGSFNTVAVGGGEDNDFIGINNVVAGTTLTMYGGSGFDTLDLNSTSTGWYYYFTEFEQYV